MFMTPQEMVTLTLLADVDNNGKIDYQELMKHFEELYVMVKYHAGLQAKVEDSQGGDDTHFPTLTVRAPG